MLKGRFLGQIKAANCDLKGENNEVRMFLRRQLSITYRLCGHGVYLRGELLEQCAAIK